MCEIGHLYIKHNQLLCICNILAMNFIDLIERYVILTFTKYYSPNMGK